MAPTAPRPSTHGTSPNTTALDFTSCGFKKFIIRDLPDDATARCLHAKDVHCANDYTPIVQPPARRFHGLPFRHAAAPVAGAFARPAGGFDIVDASEEHGRLRPRPLRIK